MIKLMVMGLMILWH